MNYKAIFLSALLVPFAITSNIDITVRIQELDAIESEKKQELSDLGKAIEEKEELIENMLYKGQVVSNKLYEKFSKEEIKKFQDEIEKFGKRFINATKIGNVKDFFMKEFFDDEKYSDVPERIKSLLVRSFIEQLILQDLIKEYEELFQEALEINREKIKLEKQISSN